MLSPELYVRTDIYLLTFTKSSLSHSQFSKGFNYTSKRYYELGQFDYGQLHCTIDSIKKIWIEERLEDAIGNWGLYIGEVKEGTIPHGVGIKLSIFGTTQLFRKFYSPPPRGGGFNFEKKIIKKI